VPNTWHSAKKTLCRVPTLGSRQRLTAVSFGTAADGPLPRATFAECFTLGKLVFAEWGPVSSVQHSVKRLVAESLALPSAALGKAFFAECPTKGTRQSLGFRWGPVSTKCRFEFKTLDLNLSKQRYSLPVLEWIIGYKKNTTKLHTKLEAFIYMRRTINKNYIFAFILKLLFVHSDVVCISKPNLKFN
jgi:hypothetical protein